MAQGDLGGADFLQTAGVSWFEVRFPREFHLMRGPTEEDHTLFASHSVWESRQDFENWTRSEAFRKAHANAGNASGVRTMYLGPPKLEVFESVL